MTQLNNGEILGAISAELVARGRPASGQFSYSELVALVTLSRDIGVANAMDVVEAIATG